LLRLFYGLRGVTWLAVCTDDVVRGPYASLKFAGQVSGNREGTKLEGFFEQTNLFLIPDPDFIPSYAAFAWQSKAFVSPTRT
jgi:hypothetical protein